MTNVEIVLGLRVDDGAGRHLLSELQRYTTSITSFSLRMDRSPSRRRLTPSALLPVLQGLESVRRATIPLHESPGEHLQALGAAPHLEELDLLLLESPTGDGSFAQSTLFEGSEAEIAEGTALDSLSPALQIEGLPVTPSPPDSQGPSDIIVDPYPSLHTLGVMGYLTDIVYIVRDTTQHLRQLHLTVPSIRNEHEMTRAMRRIAVLCPHLTFIDIQIGSADHPEWVDLVPLNQRPLEIHAHHPIFEPHILVWRRQQDGDMERGYLLQ